MCESCEYLLQGIAAVYYVGYSSIWISRTLVIYHSTAIYGKIQKQMPNVVVRDGRQD